MPQTGGNAHRNPSLSDLHLPSIGGVAWFVQLNAWVGSRSEDTRRWLLAALLVAAPGLAIITERLDRTLGSLLATQEASGRWEGPSTLDLGFWWFCVVLAIVVVFALAWVGIDSTFTQNDWREPTGWFLAIVWAVWTVTGALSVSFDGFPDWVRQGQEFGRFAIGALVAVMLVAVGNARGVSPRATWKSATIVRVHLLVLALLFGLIYLLPMTAGQAADVFRTWSDTTGQQAAFGLAAALVLGEMIRESGLRILKAEHRGLNVTAAPGAAEPAAFDPEGLRAFRMLAAIPTAILFVGAVSAASDSVLLDTQLDWPVIKTCIAALACGVFLIVLMRTVVEPAGPVDLENAPRGVAPLPANAALWGVGLVAAIFIAFVPWLAYALALALLAFVEWQRRSGNADTPIKWALPLNGARIIAVGMAVSVLWDPIDVSRGIGVAGVALIACAGLLGILHFAVRRAGLICLPVFRIRIPVVTLLGAFVFFALWKSPPVFHQARAIPAESAPHGTITVAVQRWLDRELAVARASNQGTDPDYLPVLLVGASGGGSKAAYWTDLVLDCVVGGKPLPARVTDKSECESDASAARRARGVFLTSSVSGGSVGIAHYVQNLASVQDGKPWVDDSSGEDLLSPTIAWGLFHDFPLLAASFISFGALSSPDPRACDGARWDCRFNLDRAAVQENAIAGRAWSSPPDKGETLTRLWKSSIAEDSAKAIPATVFNSALSGSRGRVLVSPFDLAPQSVIDERCRPVALNPSEVVTDAVDAQDMLAKFGNKRFDFDITTAALLSGRFPIVDPPARIGTAKAVEPKPTGTPPPCIPKDATRLPAVIVRDGGYVENSGLLTIVQLLPAIKRGIDEWRAAYAKANPDTDLRVEVWSVSVDDDPIDLENLVKAKAETPAPSSIAQKAGPDNMLTALAREALLLQTPPIACYLRISPDPRIGAHAATGWALSKTTRLHDLVASVGPDSQNIDAIDALRTFLAGQGANCRQAGAAGSGPPQPAAS